MKMCFKPYNLFLLASALVVIGTNPSIAEEDLIFRGKPSNYEDYGYLVRGAAWQFEPNADPVIFVCWENPTTDNEDARSWIKDQISKTWERHTRLNFRGWERCAEKNSGIRILIHDDGPHVKDFGKRLDGVKDGMILNATFKNWGPSCQKSREACIRSIAVHEFGHAIGFAHEQNRPDTPGECSRQFGQGQTKEEMLTPYDPHSVMNYCNPVNNNDGNLSSLDIQAAQQVYGKR